MGEELAPSLLTFKRESMTEQKGGWALWVLRKFKGTQSPRCWQNKAVLGESPLCRDGD